MKFAPSELIINDSGSIYHLNLHPEQISDIIFLVGDPGRVERVSRHFDKIDHRVQKREFITHTGWYKGVRMSVISTGIGTDNIDIVLNELDALANIDIRTKEINEHFRQLTLIRLGTSGSLQQEISPGSLVVSSHAIGFDGLLHYYHREPTIEGIKLENAFLEYCNKGDIHLPLNPYGSKGNITIQHRYFSEFKAGITLTASGFYAPQSRQLRIKGNYPNLFNQLHGFSFEGYHFTNMEMETAAIYGLSEVMGHRALSVNAILANRATGEFAQEPGKLVDDMIRTVLENMTKES